MKNFRMKTRSRTGSLALSSVLLGIVAAYGLLAAAPWASAASPFHGIGLAKGCTSPIVIGQLYTCDVLTINNVDTGPDTLTITSIVDVVHAGAGDQTSGNLLPTLSLTFTGGASCAPGQTICTLPPGSSISTLTPYGFYFAQSTDPNPLTDTIHLTWQDLCTSLALNCPIGDQMATAGSSAVLVTATPTATATATSTATPTSTATATASSTSTAVIGVTSTPVGSPTPGVIKVPEGNAANANQAIPAANLYLCVTGPCSGPGEGNLHVVEYASGVVTDPANAVPGLGAYEFNVEYDNFVIQSVNPCDIVFGPGGAGALRGPVDELNSSSPQNPDCTPDPGAANNGQCTMSFVLENIVRFGCVTIGTQNPGPQGSFALASLDLVPHPDLSNDIFPGNNNGVVTIIKDNGCEVVDIYGHAVQGSVNGGLTPVCGDLAVTVRILEGDVNLDCKVDVLDEQAIATRYGGFFGSLLYSKWYDLEPATHDLDVDIKDLQKVFGRDGSTCQNPIPAQPPVGPPAPFGN